MAEIRNKRDYWLFWRRRAIEMSRMAAIRWFEGKTVDMDRWYIRGKWLFCMQRVPLEPDYHRLNKVEFA